MDEVKIIASFILSYPLSAILKRLPERQRWQKNVFIILVSLFYMVGLFDLWAGLRTIIISSVTAYAIAHYIDGTFMPWIAFVFLMGHMSVNHITRQRLASPSTVDITGAQMVLIMKLHAFCWNVHDGRIKPELLTDQQKDRAIKEMPEFLDFAGYVLFFPSFFAGPAFDYVDYRRWIETTMFDTPDESKAPPNRKSRKIPHSGWPAAWKAATGLIWIFLFLKFGVWYNTDLVTSPEYLSYSLFRRIFILEMYGLCTRMKYYGVWSLTEGACILSGLGHNGVDRATGKVRWDRLENVNPWTIETAQNSRAYLEGWNKNTNHWLRNYVYLRVTAAGKKPGFRASLLTFATSAFWHGFEPGYYLTFVFAAFIQTVAKNFRRYVRPFFMTPDGKNPTSTKIYYDVASYLATQLAFCFCTAPFVILDLNNSLRVWAEVYFYAIIGVIISMIFFASPAKQYLIQRLNARNHPHLRKTVSEETNHLPSLGLPSDPGREIDDAFDEVKAEIERRQRRGSTAQMPSGADLRREIEKKLGRKIVVDKTPSHNQTVHPDVDIRAGPQKRKTAFTEADKI